MPEMRMNVSLKRADDGALFLELVARTVPQAVALERLRLEASEAMGLELQLAKATVVGGGARSMLLPLAKAGG